MSPASEISFTRKSMVISIAGMSMAGISLPAADVVIAIFMVMITVCWSPTRGCKCNTVRGSLPASSSFTGDFGAGAASFLTAVAGGLVFGGKGFAGLGGRFFGGEII